MKTNRQQVIAPVVTTPTPRDIAEAALAHYAVHHARSSAEIAQAAEALRLLHERTEAANALFVSVFDAAPPVTNKQRDLLARLGYQGELHNCGHASEVIGDLLDKRRLTQRGASITGNSSRDRRAQ